MKLVFIDASITSTGVAIYDTETDSTLLYTYSSKLSSDICFTVGKFDARFIAQPRETKKKPVFIDHFHRYMHIAETIGEFVVSNIGSDFKIYIEGYAFAGKGKTFNIGEFGGLLKQCLYNNIEKNNPVFVIPEIPPTEWKKFNTGNGNAPKKMVYDSMMKTPLREVLAQLLVLGHPYKDGSWVEDIADVYAIQRYILATLK